MNQEESRLERDEVENAQIMSESHTAQYLQEQINQLRRG